MTDFPDFDPDNDEVINREIIEHRAPATDRSIARRVALQALYELDTTDHQIDDVLNHNINYSDEHRRVRAYVTRLVNGVSEHKTQLDDVIQQYASEWPIHQVAVIDRNILRIALYELAINTRTPVGVAIDEAIELAKLFGAENAPRFVNGVLGTIADNLDAVRAAFSQLSSVDLPDGDQ